MDFTKDDLAKTKSVKNRIQKQSILTREIHGKKIGEQWKVGFNEVVHLHVAHKT